MSLYDVKGQCVYLLKEEDSRLCKIGRTQHLKDRIADLEKERQCKLIPIDVVSVQSRGLACGLETKLHHHFRPQRIKGEWFAFDDVILNWHDTVKLILNDLESSRNKPRLRTPKRLKPQTRKTRPPQQSTQTPPVPVIPTITEDYVSPTPIHFASESVYSDKHKKDWKLTDLLLFLK